MRVAEWTVLHTVDPIEVGETGTLVAGSLHQEVADSEEALSVFESGDGQYCVVVNLG